MQDFSKKADNLSNRMNQITEKLTGSLDLADELTITGDEIEDLVKEKTKDIDLYSEDIDQSIVINLEQMVDDFKYVRETLKENADNGRRVLNSVTLDLLEQDEDKRASLIMSFAELNKAVADNMKLFILSYKEISKTLLNLEAIKQKNAGNISKNNNNARKAISTADLISKINEE